METLIAISSFFLQNEYMKKIDEKFFVYPEGEKKEATIDSLLAPGEEVLWRGKPNRKAFIGNAIIRFLPFALLWLCFDIGFVVMMFFTGAPWFVYLIMAIFLLFHLIPVWAWIMQAVSASKRQKEEEYAFTPTRILIRKGFIGSNTVSVPYISLTSLNLRVGLIEKMFHVGDIYIVEGNNKYVLEDLEHADFILSRLEEIAHAVKTDIIFPNAYRPNENPGYQTGYVKEEDQTKDNIQ